MTGTLAILFDFDGTLADSYAAIAASVNHAGAADGLAARWEAAVRPTVGGGLPYLPGRTVTGCDQPADQARYRQHHPAVMRQLTQLLPGAAAVLRWLKRLGKRIGICSNKPRIFTSKLLDHLCIGVFVVVVLDPR